MASAAAAVLARHVVRMAVRSQLRIFFSLAQDLGIVGLVGMRFVVFLVRVGYGEVRSVILRNRRNILNKNDKQEKKKGLRGAELKDAKLWRGCLARPYGSFLRVQGLKSLLTGGKQVGVAQLSL